MEETDTATLQSLIAEQETRIVNLEAVARINLEAYRAVIARLAEIELRLVNGF